jgi:hypothetical protein
MNVLLLDSEAPSCNLLNIQKNVIYLFIYFYYLFYFRLNFILSMAKVTLGLYYYFISHRNFTRP